MLINGNKNFTLDWIGYFNIHFLIINPLDFVEEKTKLITNRIKHTFDNTLNIFLFSCVL